mmetsp:Transcript_4115/g.9160  ORF Transcript_4115/g.9160 Transcript_4115/m.9160 type:complete len:96 (+) Transcript_4115:3955-4242(+)
MHLDNLQARSSYFHLRWMSLGNAGRGREVVTTDRTASSREEVSCDCFHQLSDLTVGKEERRRAVLTMRTLPSMQNSSRLTFISNTHILCHDLSNL